METKVVLSPFPSNLCFTLLKSPQRTHYHFPSPNTTHLRRLCVLRASASPDNDGAGEQSNGGTPNAAAERHSSPTTMNIRYRSRRQQAKQKQQQKQQRAPPPPKKWEEKTVGEKAAEFYLGEKGLLFWLNKVAYASIFVIIGGWILFRFVGPSLGLYQLDSPPLSPTSVFKGE